MARILTTLMHASNAQTRASIVEHYRLVVLIDITVWFILRAAMTPQFNLRTSRLLLTVVTFFVFEMAVAPGAVAQKLPTATERERETKSATVRRERRKKARQTAPAASRTSASVQSDQFLDLGDRFREQEKWKAAEAAYKEAINVWPGNVDALVELGFLYLDRNKLNEAQQTYSRLRPLHASYASDLLAEINRRKAALAH